LFGFVDLAWIVTSVMLNNIAINITPNENIIVTIVVGRLNE
jgi:uncharacterized membrane protein